jgi:hypothetical protein
MKRLLKRDSAVTSLNDINRLKHLTYFSILYSSYSSRGPNWENTKFFILIYGSVSYFAANTLWWKRFFTILNFSRRIDKSCFVIFWILIYNSAMITVSLYKDDNCDNLILEKLNLISFIDMSARISIANL